MLPDLVVAVWRLGLQVASAAIQSLVCVPFLDIAHCAVGEA